MARTCVTLGSEERARLYSNWVVRFPAACVIHMDLQEPGERKFWLQGHPSDTPPITDMLDRVRAFSEKDSEVVVMTTPSSTFVEVWHPYKLAWVPLADIVALFPELAISLNEKKALPC